MLIRHKSIQTTGCTLVVQLLHNILIQIVPTSEETIEEGSGGGEDVYPDGDVYQNELPGFDDDTCKEDSKRYLEDHHCHDVRCLTHNHPLYKSTFIKADYLDLACLCEKL